MNPKLLLAGGLLLAATTEQRVHAQAAATNNNVILYIGDGFGLAPKTAARMAMGQGRDGKRFASDPGFQVLALDKLKYNATVTTHSLNSWITDSAPGASVYQHAAGGLPKHTLAVGPYPQRPLRIPKQRRDVGLRSGAGQGQGARGKAARAQRHHALPGAQPQHGVGGGGALHGACALVLTHEARPFELPYAVLGNYERSLAGVQQGHGLFVAGEGVAGPGPGQQRRTSAQRKYQEQARAEGVKNKGQWEAHRAKRESGKYGQR
jgi:hypothetical protein